MFGCFKAPFTFNYIQLNYTEYEYIPGPKKDTQKPKI